MTARPTAAAIAVALFGTVLFALPCGRARAEAAPHLVIRGRIVHASYTLLPQHADEITLDSLWTYRVKVLRVIKGTERRRQVVVRGISDPQIRSDKSFVFDLSRARDGAYEIKGLR